MKTISSAENKIFKACRQLDEKKYRDRTGTYIIEGENLIVEAVKTNAKFEYVLVRESVFDNFKNLISEIDGEKVYALSDRLFRELADTETAQGIMAVVGKPDVKNTEAIRTIKKDGNIVILDRLQDPGNIGTIIRTADAAGFGAVIAVKGTADIFSPKVIRAAAGSVFRMPIFFCDGPQEVLAEMKKSGKRTVATCFDTEHYYYEENLRKNTALIIGNEGGGISKEFSDGADVKIKIPMSGSIDSLNAAVAAAILMYESVRR